MQQRLEDAARSGDVLDLGDGDPPLPAEALRAVLVRRDPAISCLTIHGAEITGPLALPHAELPVLSFVDCTFDDWITLSDASVRALDLRGCHLVGLNARNAVVAGTVALTSCHVSERIDLAGARVSGRLDLSASTIEAAGGGAGLDGDDLFVGGTLEAGHLVAREVVLSSASIGGHLRLQGATLTSDGEGALRAPGLRVEGAVTLQPSDDRRFSAHGGVRLEGASIGAALLLDGALFEHPSGTAFEGEAITVGGAVSGCPLEGHRMVAKGAFGLMNARAAKVDLSGARFDVATAVAVNLAGVEVTTDLQCSLAGGHPFEVHGGSVVVTQAEVGDQLSFSGAELDHPDDLALTGDGITVHGPAFFSCKDGRRFTSRGQVRLVDGDFRSSVVFAGASLQHPGGEALSCDRIKVAANMFLDRHEEEDEDDIPFEATGSITFLGSLITGQLSFDEAEIPGLLGLSACSMASARLLFAEPPAAVSLVNSTVGSLYVFDGDRKRFTARHVLLDGLTYKTLNSISHRSVREHLEWLEEGADAYRPQPYEQLASVYAAHGHEDEARAVLIAKQKRRRRALPPYARLGSFVLGATVAHGYRSSQAGLWLLALLAVGTSLFGLAFGASTTDLHADLTPARDATQVAGFNAFIYTLDVLLPVIDLGQATAWNAHGAAQWIAVALALSGWLLTAALVAGIAARRR